MTQSAGDIRIWLRSLLLLTAGLAVGWFTGTWSLAAVFAVAAVVLPILSFARRPLENRQRMQSRGVSAEGCESETADCDRDPVHVNTNSCTSTVNGDSTQLADRLIAMGRSALLLRPRIARGLDKDELIRATNAFDDIMSVVPGGHVLLESWRLDGEPHSDDAPRSRLVQVDALYLDRYPVTNHQFQQFIDDGGYEQMALWDTSIWPAVLDFVDRTGSPGPRFWSDGRYPAKMGNHPVVGVSWYEAAAYARWAGKRLPSDPEWVKAACWPVITEGTRPIQRRYPWGNTMDRERANIWGSGSEGTVAVDQMPRGVSVGGACHLIGNVWEWTTSDFGVWDATARRLELPTPMKSIRGGAFDTYFETQATCQFQSGECPVHRKRNIGFRCALSMCDVVSLEQRVSERTVSAPAMAGVALDEETR